jgi:hypothetical protein
LAESRFAPDIGLCTSGSGPVGAPVSLFTFHFSLKFTMRSLLTTLLVAALASGAAAQTARPIPLGKPEATFPQPTSSPVGFRVLSDGRVLVADNIESAVSLLDFHTGQATPVGRQGEGPGEFGMPGALFAGAGDTTYMMDMGNRRLLVITPDGTISSNTVSLFHRSGWPIIPRGVDAKGRIYFDLAGIAMPGLNEMVTSGRAPLIRWDRAADRMDTVAYVQFPPQPPVGPGEVRVSIGGGGPYQPRDDWAVLPDGRVGLARATGYHVEWYGTAGPVTGPPVNYEPVKIGSAEKNAWADRMAARGLAVEIENGQRRTTRIPRPNIDRQQWPGVMPPFTGTLAVLAAPTGELWVRRAQPASSKTPVYDVFDARGRLTRQVALDGDRTILGFGSGTVYVARTDDDDLQWIERYKRP